MCIKDEFERIKKENELLLKENKLWIELNKDTNKIIWGVSIMWFGLGFLASSILFNLVLR